MLLSRVFLFAIFVRFSAEYPAKKEKVHGNQIPFAPRTEFLFEKHYDRQAITKRLQAWKPDDKQNIWELSGLLEGDIMPSSQIANRNGLLDDKMRWPDGVVPLQIREEDFDEEQMLMIIGAIKEYHNKTCLRFRRYRETDKDYVRVQSSETGCWSYVGRQGHIQIMNLQAPYCISHGVIIHEFLHTLGFYHQQSAADRDDWVQINWNNIRFGMNQNFIKYDNDTVTDYGIEYDYASVMHYSAYAFSKNGEPTIEPKMEGVEIGQRKGFSEKDVNKVQLMYKSICEARRVKKNQLDYYDF